MPEMITSRDRTLAHLGHTLNFKKGEPTWVPPECVAAAEALGADFVDPPPEEVAAPAPTEPQGEARAEAIFAAFELLTARNGREDFTASGSPKVDAVRDMIGFKADKREVDAAWTKFAAQKTA